MDPWKETRRLDLFQAPSIALLIGLAAAAGWAYGSRLIPRLQPVAAATGILGLALALGAVGWPDALSQVVRRTPMGGGTLTDGDDPRAELIVKALVAFVIAGGVQWLHR